jgi:hypothetical protein
MSEAELQARFVSGLGEALFKGDSEKIASLLSRVRVGEEIKTWGLVLRVDDPTPEEMALMVKSRDEEIEYALIRVGDNVRELKGRRAEVDERESLRIAAELSGLQGEKTFTHTHWDKESTPVPSGPDIGMFRQLFEQWGYKCRVVSWLPGGKTFEFLGEYSVK